MQQRADPILYIEFSLGIQRVTIALIWISFIHRFEATDLLIIWQWPQELCLLEIIIRAG